MTKLELEYVKSILERIKNKNGEVEKAINLVEKDIIWRKRQSEDQKVRNKENEAEWEDGMFRIQGINNDTE